ncbi:MAG TPA: hypothetical protein VIW68_04040 [Candidatus Sulfotelmatobacter sp.]
MSPLVQRPRAQSSRGNPTDQHWSMLVFESCSAGVGAVFVGLTILLVVVGIYVVLVWPLTFWDLANAGLEKYAGWAQTALWSLFAGGTGAGFWCFSGAAFKDKPARKAVRQPVRSGRSVRI